MPPPPADAAAAPRHAVVFSPLAIDATPRGAGGKRVQKRRKSVRRHTTRRHLIRRHYFTLLRAIADDDAILFDAGCHGYADAFFDGADA